MSSSLVSNKRIRKLMRRANFTPRVVQSLTDGQLEAVRQDVAEAVRAYLAVQVPAAIAHARAAGRLHVLEQDVIETIPVERYRQM